MGDFGELVLVIGDMHIPHRVHTLPEQFQSLLVPGKIQHVLCTGNLTSRSQLDHLQTLAKHVHCVRGDMDSLDLELPERKVVQIGRFRIGLVHGHQVVPWGDPDSLSAVVRELGVDVLITGHTHKHSIYETSEGKHIVNPGSATGAYSPTDSEVRPSFILMAVKGTRVVVFNYELEAGGKVGVSKSEFGLEADK